MSYCTKCGASFEEYARFCPKCGHPSGYGRTADQHIIVGPTTTGQRASTGTQTVGTEGSSQAGTIATFFGSIALVAGLLYPFGGLIICLIALIFGFTASNRREPNSSAGLAIGLAALIVSLLSGVFWYVLMGRVLLY